MIKNKKGQTGYSTIFLYRMLLLLVLIFGVVIVIGNYYGKPIDLRQIEAQSINDKIASCLTTYRDYDITGELLENCFDYDLEQTSTKIEYGEKSILLGNDLILTICPTEKTSSKVICYENEYLIFIKNIPTKIKIKTGISKVEKNV